MFFSICDTVKLYYLKHWPKMSYFFSKKKKKSSWHHFFQCLLWVLWFWIHYSEERRVKQNISSKVWGMSSLKSIFNIVSVSFMKENFQRKKECFVMNGHSEVLIWITRCSCLIILFIFSHWQLHSNKICKVTVHLKKNYIPSLASLYPIN